MSVAIVTGGASGIGLALGRALAGRDVHVVLADRDAQRLAAASAVLRREGHEVTAAEVDVTDAAAVRDLIHGTHGRHGRLDAVFNNAGIGMDGEPDELALAHWERAIDVNLRGVVHGCHAAYPLMKRQGHGRIVNTASLTGLVPGTGTIAPYAATKHAVVGLSLALRVAGVDFGVGVHVVCPGVVDTPLLDKPNAPDLPPVPSASKIGQRALLQAMGTTRPYPADRLAADVLRGIARNRAIIVAPRTAGIAWAILRSAPSLAEAIARRRTRSVRRYVASARSTGGPGEA